jgi:GntR family transcriptional regulator, uxu operon transcriptional repressor
MATADEALRLLRRAIDKGDFPSGGRLPPERELAMRLSVGRGTLRKAFDALAREGRIRRRVGQGTFVVDCGGGPLAIDADPSPSDVMETRFMVEPAIAAAAALRATRADLDRLSSLAAAGPGGDWRDWEDRDNAFHTALAAASRNPLLVGLLETLHRMRRRDAWSRLRRATLTPERQSAQEAQHRAIVAAVAAADPAAASAAMRDHLTSVQAAMLAGAAENGAHAPQISEENRP